ncbi:MAG: hypothetical protein ACTS7E_03420 [Arsenophonus sp. NC-CH8-MAG3]
MALVSFPKGMQLKVKVELMDLWLIENCDAANKPFDILLARFLANILQL